MSRRGVTAAVAAEEHLDDGEVEVRCEYRRCKHRGPRNAMSWCGDCSSHVCGPHFITHVDCCEACHRDRGGDDSLDDVEGNFRLDDDETNTYQLIDGFTFDRFE